MVVITNIPNYKVFPFIAGGRCGRDRMVGGFTTTYAISEFESHSGEVYLLQHYMIKFVTNLRSVLFSGYSGFLHQ